MFMYLRIHYNIFKFTSQVLFDKIIIKRGKTMHMPTKRVIKILKCLSLSDSPLSLSEISKYTDISISTLQPILRTLNEYKYISQNELKQYQIGIELFKIGNEYINNNATIDIIRNSMKNIVHGCNEITQLGILDDNNINVIYIAKEEPYQAIKLMSSVGKALPAYASALGKSLLSNYNPDIINKIFSTTKLEPLTSNTITDVNKLIDEINQVKIDGYSHEKGESDKDIECFAIPVTIRNKIKYSISVSAPIYRMSSQKTNLIKKTLLDEKIILDNLLN